MEKKIISGTCSFPTGRIKPGSKFRERAQNIGFQGRLANHFVHKTCISSSGVGSSGATGVVAPLTFYLGGLQHRLVPLKTDMVILYRLFSNFFTSHVLAFQN